MASTSSAARFPNCYSVHIDFLQNHDPYGSERCSNGRMINGISLKAIQLMPFATLERLCKSVICHFANTQTTYLITILISMAACVCVRAKAVVGISSMSGNCEKSHLPSVAHHQRSLLHQLWGRGIDRCFAKAHPMFRKWDLKLLTCRYRLRIEFGFLNKGHAGYYTV